MTTITFNPENWIDDEAKAVVKGNTVTVNGDTLTLEEMPVVLDDNGESKWDFFWIKLIHEGRKIGSISKFRNDAQWELLGCSLERNHADPKVLAGIVLSNLF